MSTRNPGIKRALLSASNKAGLVELAKQLVELDIQIIATGGTARLLIQHKIPVTDVADYTGFPSIMDGRVKTLHPKIHGGLLGRRGVDDTLMQKHDIEPIDLVIVNLYPFADTIAKPGCTLADAVEQIDIGGPTMLRAAAKNHAFVTVAVDPTDYGSIIDEIKQSGTTTLTTRQRLAAKTFAHTASYDSMIANYLNHEFAGQLPEQLTCAYTKKYDCRYGENPHQQAAFYADMPEKKGSLAAATLLQGKPLSYNNLLDSDAALHCSLAFPSEQACCAIIKHATPCGIAVANNVTDAYLNALATDPTSAFGGIIAINQTLTANLVSAIFDKKQFVEVIIAPAIEPQAKNLLAHKTNLRVLITGPHQINHSQQLRSIDGGLLVQEADTHIDNSSDFQVVTDKQPTEQQMQDLLFAWRTVACVKSNAIVFAKDNATLGIGSGQTSRVFSARIAVEKAQEAGLNLQNAVMASDAFFPFADGLEIGINAGINAVIQPGGSKRDDEVIAAANKAGIIMVFTGKRHFRH